MELTAMDARAFAPSGERSIVVGAGVAGLLAARSLARAGASVTVLERADRIGGQLEAVSLAGVQVDLGAESFATRGDSVAALLGELGLADRIEFPGQSGAWLVSDHGAAPLPPTALFGIPAGPMDAAVVAIIGLDAAERASADLTMAPVDADAFHDLGALVTDRMGEVVLQRLVDPVIRGVFSSSAREVSIDAAHPGLRGALLATGSLSGAVARLRSNAPAGAAVASLRGTMVSIVDRLATELDALGVVVETGVEVLAVDAGGVEVSRDGRRERITGRPIVAAPALASAARRTREITVVAVAVDAPELDAAPRGTGALVVAGAAGITARALTHSSAKWPSIAAALPAGRHILRLSYDVCPDDAASVAMADLAAILGCDPGVLVDLQIRTWVRTIEAGPSPGISVVGEAASMTGLASIIAASAINAATASSSSIVHSHGSVASAVAPQEGTP